MASKRNGVVIGIVAVAVIGVVAITFYSQRGRVADEDAAGAIGAAERYRAQQISDEDVILDIPGEEELAAAVFEVLTDEQKAELLGRVGEANRQELFRHYKFNEDTFNRMSEPQMAGLARSLNREDQLRIVSEAKFSVDDMALWNDAALAKAFRGLEASERQDVLERSSFDEVGFQRMSEGQMAGLARSLNREDQLRIVSEAKFSVDDMALWNDAALAKAFRGLEASERQDVLERSSIDEETFQRWTDVKRAAFSDALGAKAFETAVLQARYFERLSGAQQRQVWNRLGAAGQGAALRYTGLEADLAHGTAMQRETEFEKYTQERRAGR